MSLIVSLIVWISDRPVRAAAAAGYLPVPDLQVPLPRNNPLLLVWVVYLDGSLETEPVLYHLWVFHFQALHFPLHCLIMLRRVKLLLLHSQMDSKWPLKHHRYELSDDVLAKCLTFKYNNDNIFLVLQSPTASIGLYVDCGSIYESPISFGATHLLERMAFKTTRNRSHFRVVREVEAIGGNVQASASREQMGYTFDALKTYVPEMVELLVDCVRNPVFLDWEVNEQVPFQSPSPCQECF